MIMQKKNSIKRAQSQAGLSFAERKNFRPMAKILTLLALLMTAVTGAWATDYYVVGTMTGWQKNDQYKMTLNASAATTEYQLGIALAATDEFKVIGEDGDNPWVWYPSGDNYGQNGELTADGLYTIYFRPNGDGGSDWFYNCIYVAEGAYLAETSGEWTLTQPAFDVELEVEYFPLATLTAPTAAEGVVEGTDAALLTPGTSAEGTLAYAIGTSVAPTDQWSDAIPTAQDLEAGTCYVWYKVVGDADHSDSQPQSIAVTIAEAPAYAVTINDAGVDASNWQATPAEPKSGQTVTLSYNGKKKVKNITIEKAAEAPAAAPTLAETLTTAGMTVKVNYNYNSGENSCSFLSNGDGTYTFQSGEGNAGDSDRAKALVVEDGKLVFKQNFYNTFDNMFDLFGFSVTFDTSNNTYSLWLGLMAESNVNPSFISVEVNGTAIAVTAAQ
jgi:hypothetical protein